MRSRTCGLAEAGLGISILPRMATPQGEHPFLTICPIPDPEVSRTIGAVRRRASPL